MNIPEGMHLSYIIYHQAWYADAPGNAEQRPAIAISASAPDALAWEFPVEEYDFGSHGKAIRVGVFEDAFTAFAQLPEFFTALAEQQPTTLEEIRAILDALGAVDETPRVSPYANRD